MSSSEVTGILMVLGACTEPRKGPDTPDGGGASSDGGSEVTEISPNLIPQEELFACRGAVSDAPTRLRRINRWQWIRNVGGSVTRGWTGFSFYDNPLDPNPRSPYGSYAADDTVDESMVEIILPIVDEYGATRAGPYTGSNRLDLLREDRVRKRASSVMAPAARRSSSYESSALRAR